MVDRRGNGSPPSTVEDADRRRQRVALLWLGGLVLAAIGLWLVAMLASQGGGTQPARTDDGTASGEDAAENAAAEAADPEAADPDDSDGDGSGDEDDGDAGDPTEDETDEGADPDDGADAGADDEVVSVTFDGACTVEVPADEREAAEQGRAWEFAECTYAPVAIEGSAERWIVVRASMPADEFEVADADERADELGADGGVLWSSHYPSLTGGLWVVFDGPFPDADAARDAAEAAGGGAYVRALTR